MQYLHPLSLIAYFLLLFSQVLFTSCKKSEFNLTYFCNIFTGVYLSQEKQVFQTPTVLLSRPNGEVNLTLTHKIQRYDTILWYQRSAGDTSLRLIGYVYYTNPSVESAFQSHFSVSGDGEKTAYLHIKNLRHPEDSGEYFGAASIYAH